MSIVSRCNCVGEGPREANSAGELDESILAKIEIVISITAYIDTEAVQKRRHVVAAQNGGFQRGRESISAEDTQNGAAGFIVASSTTRVCENGSKFGD